ncbi:MAG: hypothetical protein NTY01_21150 [Verrucomicrobia bacterium]|nr:hypothetical protein [Verrucomicrobiota bacterium]
MPAGIKNGYWLNFGQGWSHLHNDDPAQLLTGAAPRLFWEKATEDGGGRTEDGGPKTNAVAPSPVPGLSSPNSSHWKLVVEATMFVTYATVVVWSGVKSGGPDPTGTYTRVSGCDPTATLTVEAV